MIRHFLRELCDPVNVIGVMVSALAWWAFIAEKPGAIAASQHRAGDPSDWSQQAVSSKAAIAIANQGDE